jgi:hypothetical protein
VAGYSQEANGPFLRGEIQDDFPELNLFERSPVSRAMRLFGVPTPEEMNV